MKHLLLILFVLPLFALAQNSDSIFIKKIADDVLANGKAYEQLRHLTKKIGGRLAGSPQMVMAENWGAATLAQVGADRVIMQQTMVPHWVRGGKDKASVVKINGKNITRPLDVLALGNSLGTGKKGVSAEVIAVADYNELEKRKDEVKGKIVFFNYPFNDTYINPGQSYGEAGKYRHGGASKAAQYGAVGAIVRSLSGGVYNHPHTGAMRYNDSFPKIPAIAVGLHDADYLWQQATKNKSVTVSFTTLAHFLPDTIGHNVIGELKGSDFPNEYITIGGHLDSWDVNEGAHDDGTGIVQTIEILRVFKALGYTPKHTIRFVLFANEENGLKGAEKYAAEAKAKNEKHIFALESDGGGFTPRSFGFVLDKEKIEKIQPWVQLLKPYGVYELNAGYGGADIGPLNKEFKTPVAGLHVDGQRYFDLHHARNDVFEEVNKRELLLGAINMAALVYLVDKYGL